MVGSFAKRWRKLKKEKETNSSVGNLDAAGISQIEDMVIDMSLLSKKAFPVKPTTSGLASLIRFRHFG